MEGFVVWLIVMVFLIASGSNKKKKAQQTKKDAAPPQPGSMTPEAREKLAAFQAQAAGQSRSVPVARMSREERAARVRELKQKRAERVANARGTAAQAAEAMEAFPEGESYGSALTRQGQSSYDDEGCVGGSLPHNHSEGESRAEHSAHIAAMRARDEEETAVAAPGRLANLDPRDLRRAVVISEILGRPRALRGTGTRQ